jgi:hypothetical protein
MFFHFGSDSPNLSSLTLPEFPAGFGSHAVNMSSMFFHFGSDSPNLSSLTLPEFPAGFGAMANNMRNMFYYFANNISTNYKGTTIDWAKTLSFTNDVNTEGMFTDFNPGTNKSQILTACESNVYTTLSNVSYKPTNLDIPNTCQPMQTFTQAQCNNLNTYESKTLTDNRNNQNYTIRKLPDNKCWMVNNLKLGSTNSEITLTPGDTNITADSFTLPKLTTTDISTDTDAQAIGPIPDYSTTDHNSKNFGGYLYNF